jgi:carboxyl-terminal processing protease
VLVCELDVAMGLRTFFLYLSLLVCIGLAFVAGFLSYPLIHPLLVSRWIEPSPQSVPPPALTIAPDPVDMTVFWQVNAILEHDFYGAKPDLTTRRYGAINGLVAAFNDPYTRYEPPTQSADSGAVICGCQGVIGVSIEQTPAGFILQPQPGLPAQQAGVLAGDQLIQVDQTLLTVTMTVDEVMRLVNGDPKTGVILVVQRQSTGQTAAETLNFEMTRIEVITPSMEWRLLDDVGRRTNIGYIRHTHFTNHSPEEMERALTELVAQGADRFILDLRANPGGTVDASLKIADMWLEQGVILIEEEVTGAEKRFDATAGQIVPGAPLVIVVDQGTASASEIVAGALRDHGRATLVGAKTYGKGSVQLRHELADKSSLFVTNALWFTPNHHQISGVGLLPDLIVEDAVDPLPTAIASVQQIAVAQR